MFIVELCNVYREGNYNEQTSLYQTLMKTFVKVNCINSEDEFTFLQQLGAMCLGTALNQNVSNAIHFEETSTETKICDMIVKNGLPADWAFTICNLLFSVHYILLKEKKIVTADLLRNFLFKNYAFNLSHKVKQVSFLSNFFACLHYDCSRTKMKDIMELGRNVLTITQENNYALWSEYRIYIAFTNVILADLKQQLQKIRNRKLTDYIPKIRNSKLEPANLQNLHKFLVQYLDLVNEKETKFEFRLLSPNDFRWKKAICSARQHPRLCSQSFLQIWLKRLGETE